MKRILQSRIAHSVAALTGLEETKLFQIIEKPKKTDFGDLALPCFEIAKLWKMPPLAAAQKLAAELSLPKGIQEIIATGPFLNFRFDRSKFIAHVMESETKFERDSKVNNVLVEYSSPNIAKPFHVGHLRATLIGNSLDRVYRKLKYNTVSINHLGDWGTQFGFVWAGCELWGKPEQPSVRTLVDLYRRATTLKEQQEKNEISAEDASLPNVNEMARAYFLDLEQGKSAAVAFWKWCSDISLGYLKRTYERLGVAFDHYTGESFYSGMLEEIRADIEGAGLLKESEGAFGVDLGEALGFARIATPDGRSLYLTRDLAAVKYRAKTFQFDRALYVVGAPQALHFQQLKGILKGLGRDYVDGVEHVSFGHVQGMKTRGGGEIVELNDFLDEAHERALKAYREQVSKRPEGLDEQEVAEAVAISAIVFSSLSRSRLKDVHFSWEHALEFQGDSGPYVLYAYARINGIRERAAEAGITAAVSPHKGLITEESAFQLALLLDHFVATLARTTEENEPAVLAAYALDVAKAFSKAYNDLKVLGVEAPLAEARLALFEKTRSTLREAASLLGMKILERM